MATQANPLLTAEQYLELETRAEFRSEYIAGEMIAMSGASLDHNQIVGNIHALLWNQLRGNHCRVIATDLRLQTARRKMMTYPDLMVLCGPVKMLENRTDTVTDATLIIEVLSASTRSWDLGQKFEYYRSLPSLAEYLVVEQKAMRASHHSRQPDGSWLLRDLAGPEAVIKLDSIQCTLTLAALYERVELVGEETDNL